MADAFGIDWGLALPRVNVGNALLAGVEQGRAARREMDQQSALAAYSANPNDPDALNKLMPYQPELAARLGQQRFQQQTAATEQAKAADMEQKKFWAKAVKGVADPAAWDGLVDWAVANGHPEAEQLRGQFSPQARLAIMAEGGEADEEVAPSAMEKDYAFLSRLNPEYGEQYVENRVNPSQWVPVTGTDGSVTLYPVPKNAAIGGGGPQPGAVEDGYRFKGGNPGDPASWEPVGGGGPTQPASGRFP
jgi:hypothetical protein